MFGAQYLNRLATKSFLINSVKRIRGTLPIVVHDGVESMSDGQYCAVSELPPYGLLNELISFQVHRGRGFVKDQKFTVT